MAVSTAPANAARMILCSFNKLYLLHGYVHGENWFKFKLNDQTEMDKSYRRAKESI